MLAPVLTAVYSESLSHGQLPNTFNEAMISLILKKDKDPLDPGYFRPVILVNVDCKVLTEVLAMRLENTLPEIIHEDQVGFVKGRSSSDRWLLHLMWKNRQEAFSLDVEKAFDRAEWGFLIHFLEAFGQDLSTGLSDLCITECVSPRQWTNVSFLSALTGNEARRSVITFTVYCIPWTSGNCNKDGGRN